MFAKTKNFFNGLVGLAVFWIVAKAVLGGISPEALIGAALTGLVLVYAAPLVTSALPDDAAKSTPPVD